MIFKYQNTFANIMSVNKRILFLKDISLNGISINI